MAEAHYTHVSGTYKVAWQIKCLCGWTETHGKKVDALKAGVKHEMERNADGVRQ